MTVNTPLFVAASRVAGMVVGAATVILWKQYADSGLAKTQTMHQQVRQNLREQGY